MLFDEGAFQEASQLGLTFEVMAHGVTYVGTWQFGVEAPHDQRLVIWSVIAEPEAVIHDRLASWPVLHRVPLTMTLPVPSFGETRLDEVPSYPRVWFFRRHQTT